MKKTLLVLLTIAGTTLLTAQEQKPLSKEQALSSALEHNRNLKISEQEFLQARADYRQTNAVFLPNITASHTGMTTTNPLMAFGSKLNQKILIQNDFNPTLLNNPQRTDNFATRIEIQQPLINVDGIFQRQAAKSKMQVTQLQGQRTQDYILLEVEKCLYATATGTQSRNRFEKSPRSRFGKQKTSRQQF